MTDNHCRTIQDKFLAFLYGHACTRMLLKPLTSKTFSNIGGRLLDSHASTMLIKPFIKANHIDMDEYEPALYSSYNDFFKRKIINGARPYKEDDNAFISPCDSRLSVYKIDNDSIFSIKNTQYTVKSLLRSRKLAEYYKDGYIWIFRLSVDDYHRYIYPVSGMKSVNRRINGVFHTVNPIANDYYPIYKENTREYCNIKNKCFGNVIMMEVGAMLVGKIENNDYNACRVFRGDEKGDFAFGGSTIVLITNKTAACPLDSILDNSLNNIETRVKQGETVGYKI